MQIKQNLGKKIGVGTVLTPCKMPKSFHQSPIDDFRSPEERRNKRKNRTTWEKEHHPRPREVTSLTLGRPAAKLPAMSSSSKAANEQPDEPPTELRSFNRSQERKYLPDYRKGSDPSSGTDRRYLLQFLNRESSDNYSDTEEQSPFTDHTQHHRRETRFHFKPPTDLKTQTPKKIKLHPLIPGLVKSFHSRQASDVQSPTLHSPQQNKSIGSNHPKFDGIIRATFKPNLTGKSILNLKPTSDTGKSGQPIEGTMHKESLKHAGNPLSIKAYQGLPQPAVRQKVAPTQSASPNISAKEGTTTALLSHKKSPDNSSMLDILDVSFNLPYYQANYRKKKPKILNLNTSITLKQAAELEGIGISYQQRDHSPGHRHV